MSALTAFVQCGARSPGPCNKAKIKEYKAYSLEIKLSLFEDDMIVYIENYMESTKKLIIYELSNVSGYKFNTQKIDCLSMY